MSVTKPINLNKARKARNKLKKRQEADENAVTFGRTKAQRILEATQNERVRKALDRHRIEDEE